VDQQTQAQADPAPNAPLAGVRVLDFSRILAGPLCTMLLADLGADVVKIERPGVGDDTRAWGPPFVGEDAAYFLALNRNKRSVALDLQDPDQAATARRLAGTADVVVENFRPGLMRRFGLDHETLSADNPGLVFCSLVAFGDDEDDSKPGYDIIVQAMSGLMSVTGERDRSPVKVGVALLDVITGLYAANGIQAALRERDRTGTGSRLTVSLYESSVAAMVNQAANFLLGGVVPGPMGTAHPNIVPYQVFEASDRPFVIAAGNDRLYERTCDALSHPELASDPRFATNQARVENRAVLVALLQEVLRTETAATWLARLEERAVPCAPVSRLDDVFASPEGAAMVQRIDDDARGALNLVANPIRLTGDLTAVRRPPPQLGEHTEEILAELQRDDPPSD
jgi:crotonobetainyl-CoA:carnitine CoA-transferase CaiB-like acyl-CoA transferase